MNEDLVRDAIVVTAHGGSRTLIPLKIVNSIGESSQHQTFIQIANVTAGSLDDREVANTFEDLVKRWRYATRETDA